MCLCLGRKLEEAGEGHEFSVCLGDEGFRYQLYCDSFFSSIMLYNESWWWLKPWWEEAVGNQDWEAVETKVWQLFYAAVPFSAKALSITPTHSTCPFRLNVNFYLHILCQVYVYEILVLLPAMWTISSSLVWLPPGFSSHCSAWGQGTK